MTHCATSEACMTIGPIVEIVTLTTLRVNKPISPLSGFVRGRKPVLRIGNQVWACDANLTCSDGIGTVAKPAVTVQHIDLHRVTVWFTSTSQKMNPNSKLRTRIRDATNEAILAAAEAVFAEEGLHSAKVETIAARAGVSVGTIYNHLGDRDNVLDTLCFARKTELIERLDRALQEGEGRPFVEQLEGFLRATMNHFEEHRKFFSILMQGEFRHESRTEQAHQAMCAVLERSGELMRRGFDEKVLRTELADFYPTLLMGMVRSAFMRDRLLKRDPEPLGPRVAHFVRFFMQGAEDRHV